MIVVLKPGVQKEKREQLMQWLRNLNLDIHVSEGCYQTVLGLVGDTSKVDMDLVASLDIVESVKRVREPFKCCNRDFHPDDTGDRRQGREDRRRQLLHDRRPLLGRVGGADRRRGQGGQGRRARTCCAAARSSPAPRPTTFQGLKAEGLELLKIARQETGLPIVTEIMNVTAPDRCSRTWT